MKNRKIFNLLALLLAGFFLTVISSCEKEDKTAIPELTTAEVTEITAQSAVSGGEVISEGGLTVSERGVCWSTSNPPTIADNKTIDGAGAGSFSSEITELEPSTTYYVRAYATNEKGTAYGDLQEFETLEYNIFTDVRDGNVYRIVEIGNQVWMAENMRYLPNLFYPQHGSETGKYCYIYDYTSNGTPPEENENYITYGVLYNWVAAMDACPAGWRLPDDEDMIELMDFLGGPSLAGGKLKEEGTEHWNSPNTGATNESGFTALPGGFRSILGTFKSIRTDGYWWTSLSQDNLNAWCLTLSNQKTEIIDQSINKGFGFSVRCIKEDD